MAKDDQPQGHAGDLKALAQLKFGRLSDAEKLLLEKVSTGDVAICGENRNDGDERNDPKYADYWEPKRQIRSALVAWLSVDTDARKHVHSRGIQIYGADVIGPLDVSSIDVPFPLVLWHCRLKEGIQLQNAEVPAIHLGGSLVHGVSADGVIVRKTFFLNDGFVAVGLVRLVGAHIGRDLDCSRGTFTNPSQGDIPGGEALVADRVNVGGVVFLDNGFAAHGAVWLPGAQIGGDIRCEGGTFTNPPRRGIAGSGMALNAEGSNVKGSVYLRQGFAAGGIVTLVGAQIGGDLDCSGGTFTRLIADRVNVNGNIFLHGRHFASDEVHLFGARIIGAFDCANGDFQSAVLDLREASASAIYDPGVEWPAAGKLLLDGFVYAGISTREPLDVAERLDWLGLQPMKPFPVRSYLQLAKVLRESGDADGSIRVLMRMEDLRRSDVERGPIARVENWTLKWSIGYGYHPILGVLGDRRLQCDWVDHLSQELSCRGNNPSQRGCAQRLQS
jgi:hypothetical protein